MNRIGSIAFTPWTFVLLVMIFMPRDVYAQTNPESPTNIKHNLIPFGLLRIPEGFFEKDSIIIITNNYDLEGRVFEIPDNHTLLFRGGSFHNGRINLGNNTSIIGAKFYTYGNPNYLRTVIGGKIYHYSIAVSIMGKDNISINNCTFISYGELPQATDIGVMVYGNRYGESSKVNIDNCTFKGCSVDFFSNVNNCRLTNSHLSGNSHLLSVETLYDEEDNGQYMHPYNIIIERNYFIEDNSNPDEPPLWCSGIEKLTFTNNHCESDCNILMLYCGDGNIALDSVRIINNEFIYPKFNVNKKNACAISCMGRSYPQMNKEKSFGEIEISNNVFNGVSNHGGLVSCRAISSRFVNHIMIHNNKFEGFSEAIYLGDIFRGYNWVTTKAEVSGNDFYYSVGTPFLMEANIDQNSCIMSAIVSHNTFYSHKIQENNTKKFLNHLRDSKISM